MYTIYKIDYHHLPANTETLFHLKTSLQVA